MTAAIHWGTSHTPLRTPAVEVLRACVKCGARKAPSEFSKDCRNPDGLHKRCRDCTLAYRRDLYRSDGRPEGENNPNLVKFPAAPPSAMAEWKERGSCRTVKFGLTQEGERTDGGKVEDRVRAWFYNDVWYAGQGVKRDAHERVLEGVCMNCPVLSDCREMARTEEYGYLAGLPARMRVAASKRPVDSQEVG